MATHNIPKTPIVTAAIADDSVTTAKIAPGAVGTSELAQAVLDSIAGKVPFVTLAKNPDLLITGSITRNTNGAVTSAAVTWPDGTPGTFTATTLSSAFPGAVDAYTVTFGSPATQTFTQPTITRDSSGAAITVPAIVVS